MVITLIIYLKASNMLKKPKDLFFSMLLLKKGRVLDQPKVTRLVHGTVRDHIKWIQEILLNRPKNNRLLGAVLSVKLSGSWQEVISELLRLLRQCLLDQS